MAEEQHLITDKQTLWTKRIADWQSSGLSQGAFCEQHGLTYTTFVYWRGRFKKLEAHDGATPVNFFPVKLKQASQNSLTIKINGRHSVEINTNFDGNLLNRIIQAIEQAA